MKTPVKIGSMELELGELTLGDLARLAEEHATRHLRAYRKLAEAGGLSPQEANKAVLAEASRIQALAPSERFTGALGIETLALQIALRSGRKPEEIEALPLDDLMAFWTAESGGGDAGLAADPGKGS